MYNVTMSFVSFKWKPFLRFKNFNHKVNLWKISKICKTQKVFWLLYILLFGPNLLLVVLETGIVVYHLELLIYLSDPICCSDANYTVLSSSSVNLLSHSYNLFSNTVIGMEGGKGGGYFVAPFSKYSALNN